MKLLKAGFWLGIVLCFCGAFLFTDSRWLGALIGYEVGFVNTFWLYRDAQRIADLDIARALRRMRRSFAFRLGLVTLIVAVIARWLTEWLLALVVGMAVGVLLSLVLFIISLVRVKGGIDDDA